LFQTEKILNGIFHFKQTTSFSQIFEDSGYVGSNFIIGIGPCLLCCYILHLLSNSCIGAKKLFWAENFPARSNELIHVKNFDFF
jgi:hypothetical protein